MRENGDGLSFSRRFFNGLVKLFRGSMVERIYQHQVFLALPEFFRKQGGRLCGSVGRAGYGGIDLHLFICKPVGHLRRIVLSPFILWTLKMRNGSIVPAALGMPDF